MTSIQEKHLDSIYRTFDRACDTVESKMADYSHADDVYSNFRVAATVAGISIHQTFLTLMGVKLARLENLLNSGAEPKNEAIADTFQDLILYAAIHKSYLENKDTVDASYAYSPTVEDFVKGAPGDENPSAAVVTEEPSSAGQKLIKLLGF